MRASALEYCLLGLMKDRHYSGYDLRKILTETPMRHYSDSPGSIYPALQRIERRGWIKSAAQSTGRRQRIVYRLTPKGNSELKRWLSQAVDEEQVAYRLDEVMLRLSFSHLLGDPASLRIFLAEMARAAQKYAVTLKEFIRASTADYPSGAALALDYGLESYESLARWAKSKGNRPSTARPTASRGRRGPRQVTGKAEGQTKSKPKATAKTNAKATAGKTKDMNQGRKKSWRPAKN